MAAWAQSMPGLEGSTEPTHDAAGEDGAAVTGEATHPGFNCVPHQAWYHEY
jgi:hypothetical protein